MLRVAVVGSGPAGVYTVAALAEHGVTQVDVLDRLPCPFGLLRYGVAPDHPRIKSIAATLRAVLEQPGVRFLGNVRVGEDVSLAELRRCYDAVVVATGAPHGRRLGIPGEDLPGSVSATDLVAWYSGHPDAAGASFPLDATDVVVLGVGNVALDVARVLLRTPDELAATDVPQPVLDALSRSRVRRVSVVGRRGPAQARFTTKELRELDDLTATDVRVDPAELEVDAAGVEAMAAEPVLRRNVEVLRGWAARPAAGQERRLDLRFLLRPVELLGTDRVEAVRLARTCLDGRGRARDTGAEVVLPAGLVLRSVGYCGAPVPGLPFDDAAGVVPNRGGRVLRDGAVAPGEYVAGWLKRGPQGVIGTNKHDAKETVLALLADAETAGTLPRTPRRGAGDPGAVLALLDARGVAWTSWEGWRAVEAAEAALARDLGRAAAKIPDWDGLLAAAAAGVDVTTGRRASI